MIEATEKSNTNVLFDRYGIAQQPSLPLGRILYWVAELDRLLRDASRDEDPVGRLIANDARRCFFMLEGLFRIYRKVDKKPISRLLDCAKEAEDCFGVEDFASSVLELARKHELPVNAVAYFDEKSRKARRKLAKFLAKEGWEAKQDRVQAIAEMLHTLFKVDWKDIDDRKVIRKALADQLADTEEKDYDMDDVEAGGHELRRQLRWFPIYLTALRTVAVLDSDSNPIPEYEPLLRDPIANSPFARLPNEDLEPNPLRFSRSLYIANTKAIADLGELKDRGLAIEAFTKALKKCDLANSKKEAETKAIEDLNETPTAMEQILHGCREVYENITRSKLLTRIREQVVIG